jgi:putative restriction endonuclease
MARLTKAALINSIISAVEGGGWVVTPLSATNEHPFRFEMARGAVRHQVRAYIWNMTHGGGAKRPPNEFRIQITKVSQFEPEPNGITLILGWNQNFGAFAAFDIAHHARALGSSPSIQIGSGALKEAARAGIATQAKGNTEVAVAVRPDHLTQYILHKDAAHGGNVDQLLLPSDDEMDFVDLADPSHQHHFGSAAEQAQRRTVLDRIAALEREIEAIKPQLSMMGHNHPPEAMEADPEILTREISDAAATVRTELARAQPDIAAVGRGAAILQRISKMLRATREEASKLAGAVKEKARDKAAELVVASIGGGALYGPQIIDAVQSTVAAISQWFRLIVG